MDEISKIELQLRIQRYLCRPAKWAVLGLAVLFGLLSGFTVMEFFLGASDEDWHLGWAGLLAAFLSMFAAYVWLSHPLWWRWIKQTDEAIEELGRRWLRARGYSDTHD